MRYKIGDKVRIVNETLWGDKDEYRGIIMTIAKADDVGKMYRMEEDNCENCWFDENIEGLAFGVPPQEMSQEESGDQFRPDYYGGVDNVYETRKFINAHNLNFNIGNVVKYVVRAGKKDDNTMVSDLNKAMRYLQFELERISE